MDGRRRWKRRVLLGGGLLVLAGLIGAGVWMAGSPEFAEIPVPNPNGYDSLLAAAKLVVGIPPAQGQADRATDEELRDFVATNKEALAEARRGLTRESVVPLGRLESLAPHLEEVGLLRQLSRLLIDRMVLARREGRIAEAADAAIDLLEYAHATAHGGLLLDQMASVAYRRQALAELGGPLLPKLAAADARRVLAVVERLDHAGEPVTIVARRDLSFSLSRGGGMTRLGYLLQRKAMDGLAAPAIRAAESAEDQARAQARILLVRLALVGYASDHGGATPPSLADLVPVYIDAIPLTPDGSRPLALADLP